MLLGVAAAPTAIPVILDQSTVAAAQLLWAGIPQAGRILPLALWVFTYPDIQNQPESRNLDIKAAGIGPGSQRLRP